MGVAKTYSRDFGGIKSDGMYSEAFGDAFGQTQPEPPVPTAEPTVSASGRGQRDLIDLSFLKRLEIDDLLIIAIGILLLLDSDISSDMILLFAAAMLFL